MLKRNVIYTTTDYEQFAFKSANRDIDPAHVKKIAGRMEQKGWQGGPIEISLAKDGKYQIEEGQHRYMAARQTKTPIRFIVVDEKDVYDTATENSMKKGWKGSDFIHAYASDGNFNYSLCNKKKREAIICPTNTGEHHVSHHKGNNTYSVQYRENGKRRQKYFHSLDEAVDFRNTIYKQVNVGGKAKVVFA